MASVDADQHPCDNEDTIKPVAKPKGKRGRKPRALTASKSSEAIQPSILNKLNAKEIVDEVENSILHLKIDIKQQSTNIDDNIDATFEEQFMTYNGVIPEPQAYDIQKGDEFISQPEALNLVEQEKYQDVDNICYKNAKCFWCCHDFTTPRVGIPLKISEGRIYTWGNFCSANCGAAFNFYSNELHNDKRESYSLFNIIAKKMNQESVKLAPMRHTLVMFGGDKTIEEFRNYSNTSKILHTYSYPMTHINSSTEEINESQYANETDFLELNKKKIIFHDTRLKLERNKPLHAKNNLCNTMNLTIKNDT